MTRFSKDRRAGSTGSWWQMVPAVSRLATFGLSCGSGMLNGSSNMPLRRSGNDVVAALVISLQFLSSEVSARTYSTTFSKTENPISEDGHWTNGKMAGFGLGELGTTHTHD